jgi:starch synthase
VDEYLKICIVSPEWAPFAKTGGLGDCVASLSKFIAQLGHEVKVILPKYAFISLPQGTIEHVQPLIIGMGYGTEYGKIWEYSKWNLSIYFIEFDRYFTREGIYAGAHGDYGDNCERFAFLSRAAIDLCYHLNWIPDVFHGHDWTTGLIPVILDTIERGRPMGQCGSVFSIHNLQHHGYAPRSVLDFLGIPGHVFREDGVEAFGQVNMMKAGLYFASKLTTVSETYSREIQTPEFGFGLDPILKFRAGDLIGIPNGIDENVWSPEIDPFLPPKFSTRNMGGKAICKKFQEYCNFAVNKTMPILGIVSRLYEQKSLDVFCEYFTCSSTKFRNSGCTFGQWGE